MSVGTGSYSKEIVGRTEIKEMRISGKEREAMSEIEG